MIEAEGGGTPFFCLRCTLFVGTGGKLVKVFRCMFPAVLRTVHWGGMPPSDSVWAACRSLLAVPTPAKDAIGLFKTILILLLTVCSRYC